MSISYDMLAEYAAAKKEEVETVGGSPARRTHLILRGEVNSHSLGLSPARFPVAEDYAIDLANGMFEAVVGDGRDFSYDVMNFRDKYPGRVKTGDPLVRTFISLQEGSGLVGALELGIDRQSSPVIPISFLAGLPMGPRYNARTAELVGRISQRIERLFSASQISSTTERVIAKGDYVWKRLGFLVNPFIMAHQE